MKKLFVIFCMLVLVSSLGFGQLYPRWMRAGFFPNVLGFDKQILVKELSSAPSETSGYGTLYVLSSDGDLYYKDDDGNTTNLGTIAGTDAFTLKVDSGATAGYFGVAYNDGIFRFTQNHFTMADGGNYVTLSLADHATARTALGLGTADTPQFNHLGLGGAAFNVDYGINYADEVLTDTDNSPKYGGYFFTQVAKTAAEMTGVARSLSGYVVLDSTNTQNWSNAHGIRGVQSAINTEGGSTGTVTGAAAFYSSANIADAATVTNLYGLYITTPAVAGSKLTNDYGLYIADKNQALTLNYAIYTNAGLVRLGGALTLATVAAAGTDTDKFLVLDGTDNVDYRSGANVLSDIGGAAASHAMSTHSDEDTYSISTSGDLTVDDATVDKIEANEAFTYDAVQTATGDGTTTIDWGLGNLFYFTFGAQNDAFTFTAPPGAAECKMWIKQDGTGSRTMNWAGVTILWPGDVEPTLSTGANAVDIIGLLWDGTSWHGLFNGDFR